MADDKRQNAKDEHARDEEYNRELMANDRAQRQREEEEKQRKKEKFRQEAIEHWEDAKRLKAQQKEGRI